MDVWSLAQLQGRHGAVSSRGSAREGEVIHLTRSSLLYSDIGDQKGGRACEDSLKADRAGTLVLKQSASVCNANKIINNYQTLCRV